MFKLKRPCANCPFKRGIGSGYALSKKRLFEIVNGEAFQCHKTVDYDHHDDPRKRQGDNPQQCAGLMSLLKAEETPNTIMQVGERLGAFKPDELDPDKEAYQSFEEVVDAHQKGIETWADSLSQSS